MQKPKVEILQGDTPSQVVQAEKADIKDSLGRIITVRRPPILEKFRFIKILGDNSSNDVYLKEISIYNWVSAIDGSPVTKNSERELEALIQRLGYEGHQAILEGIMQLIGQETEENEQQEKDLIKK